MSRLRNLQEYADAASAPEPVPEKTSDYTLGYNKGFNEGARAVGIGLLGGILTAAIVLSFLF